MPISETSNDANPAVKGENTDGGFGIHGKGGDEAGVVGESEKSDGVYGITHGPGKAGVTGNSKEGMGVYGWGARAIVGVSETGDGVYGESLADKPGVVGISRKFDGVYGIAHDPARAGVSGHNPGGLAGYFEGNVQVTNGLAARTTIEGWDAVYGESIHRAGVVGVSHRSDGIYGRAHDPARAGVSGHNPGGLAGYFEGNVVVTGDVQLSSADCAEQFDVAELTEADPGTVMVLGEDGSLRPSSDPYDKRVVGVVSGAGSYKPGIVLDQRETGKQRRPIALLGKVFCKVDTRYGAIEIGDLLTTSSTRGHAMKADDPLKAFGAVIGKALQPLKEGQGLIQILIALQ